MLPTGHPLAAAEIIDPRDLAEEPLHVPRDEGNQDIYDLALELLADNGLATPRLAPTSVSLAAVMQHIAAGDGWTIMSDIVVRHPVPGITGCPLAIDPPREAREVLREIIWHRDTDALADQTLQRPPRRCSAWSAPSPALLSKRSWRPSRRAEEWPVLGRPRDPYRVNAIVGCAGLPWARPGGR
ncbi:MAG: LysR substrate-binding domain-containing protein [Solirubrobacteraceae bacterium]